MSRQQVSAALDTTELAAGGVGLAGNFIKVSEAGSGDLIALVTGKKIRVVAGLLVAAAAETIKFQTGATTDLTGAMTMAAGVPLVLPFCPLGHFETVAGAKLNAVQGGTVQVSGWLVYVLV